MRLVAGRSLLRRPALSPALKIGGPDTYMFGVKFTLEATTMSRFNGVLAFAAVLATLMAGIAGADARPGFGGSFGSRGTRTFSPPPITRTAPNPAGPMERSMTQPARPTPGLAPTPVTRPGFFNRPGFFGGLLTGFLGAGLLGLL